MADEGTTTLLAQTHTDAGTAENTGTAPTETKPETPATPEPKDQKPADDKKGETKPETGEAPTEYTFKVPEGMTLNESALKDFTPLAKELGLSQEKAQKMVDMGTKLVQEALEGQTKQFEAQRIAWVGDVKKDSEIGGVKMQENINTAIKARNQFGTPELSKILDESGLGNNPEVVRFFYRVGKAISEDTFVKGNNPGSPKSFSKTMYEKSDHKD